MLLCCSLLPYAASVDCCGRQLHHFARSLARLALQCTQCNRNRSSCYMNYLSCVVAAMSHTCLCTFAPLTLSIVLSSPFSLWSLARSPLDISRRGNRSGLHFYCGAACR